MIPSGRVHPCTVPGAVRRADSLCCPQTAVRLGSQAFPYIDIRLSLLSIFCEGHELSMSRSQPLNNPGPVVNFSHFCKHFDIHNILFPCVLDPHWPKCVNILHRRICSRGIDLGYGAVASRSIYLLVILFIPHFPSLQLYVVDGHCPDGAAAIREQPLSY